MNSVKSLLHGHNGNEFRDVRIDQSTRSLQIIDYAHHEIHGGSSFFLLYSVASLGAMSSPDDMITLSFTTPDTTKWGHFTFSAKGTAGWRVRLIEGKTGGGDSPTGSLTILNHNRNSATTSVMKDLSVAPAAGKISYDAALFTGGLTIWDEYLEGSSGPKAAGAGSGARNEIILKQNEDYQLSLYGTDTDPATLYIDWYEHTDKPA